MGKTALILVLGLSISLQFLKNSLYQKPLEAVETVGSYYSKSTSKNVAHSAMNDYLMKLHQNKNLRGTFAERNKYLEGSVDTVRINSTSTSTTSGDTIVVSAVAHYGGQSSSIEVALLGTAFEIPPLTGAMAYAGPQPKLTLKGTPLIDGRNHDKNGNLSSTCDDLPGVAVAASADSSDMVDNQIKNKDKNKIKGLGSNPSVHVRETTDPSIYKDLLISSADFALPAGVYSSTQYGTDTDPVVVYGEGNLKFAGHVTGYGILFIDGTLTLAGNFTWYGVIYVIGPQPKIFTKVGTSRIIGGVVFGGSNKQAELKGTSDIWYSCETINHIQDNISSLLTFNMLSWYE
jgi:hypothetical protein